MKILIKLRSKVQGADGNKVYPSDGNTVVKGGISAALSARLTTIESSITSLNTRLSGYGDTSVATCSGTITVLAK